MTEQEYIDVSNIVRLRFACAALMDITGRDQGIQRTLNMLFDKQSKLEARINIEVIK